MLNAVLQKIDELLSFLPVLSNNHNEYIDKSAYPERIGSNTIIFPFPIYQQYVYDFFRVASNEFWNDSNYLNNPIAEMIKDDSFISAASFGQVKSLLTYCCRGERFCDGFWDYMLKTGRIQLILERLAKLRELITDDEYYRRLLMTKKQLEKILNNDDWDFGNTILYTLCSDFPLHKNKDEILAKILFIGRIYAATVDRRKNKTPDELGDDFYIKTVVPSLKNSKLDQELSKLDIYSRIDETNFVSILETHKYLLRIFYKLTKLQKRSLCSKYLHFHRPDLFFIYDSRVASVLKDIPSVNETTNNMQRIISKTTVDKEYSKFVIKSLEVRNRLEEILKSPITPREYDKILLYLSKYKKYQKANINAKT